MLRRSSVALAEAATMLIHFYEVTYSDSWFINVLCHLPTSIFLIGCGAFVKKHDILPVDFLQGLDPQNQFIIRFLIFFMLLNVCVHGFWFSIESFILFGLPDLIDSTITLTPSGKWYGLITVPEKLWTSILALLVSLFCLATISPRAQMKRQQMS
ncbi:uncharacterized protein LOC106673151 [Cimex lectularius]|uniref:Uncharacterized protein n=1 Tax=Cimex lectularius TaxID=79782 RepID=A0A8I6SGP8_CIMLE|nr:uncharacterized protein LOC106673151 [Cimex lectularius]